MPHYKVGDIVAVVAPTKQKPWTFHVLIERLRARRREKLPVWDMRPLGDKYSTNDESYEESWFVPAWLTHYGPIANSREQ